jgi:hypothetical protein
MMIRAQISSDTIAEAEGIAVHSGSPVLALCRQLVAAGHGSTAAMEVYRGDVLALRVRNIGEAAGLRVNTAGSGFIRSPDSTSAPPTRLTQPSSMARPRTATKTNPTGS